MNLLVLTTVSLLIIAIIAPVSAASDTEIFNSMTKGIEFATGLVKVLVYVDSSYKGDASVCLQYRDTESCQKGIQSGEKVPFAVPQTPDDEGIYIPKGKDFLVCVHVSSAKENCVTADNEKAMA